jgi:hypothetical protein
MKKTKIACIAALVSFLAPVYAQRPDVNPEETLRQAIVKYPYTWDHSKTHYNIKFNADGTGTGQNYDFTWRVVGPHDIEIVRGAAHDQSVRLTFSADFTSYEGTLQEKIPKVSGHQWEPRRLRRTRILFLPRCHAAPPNL